MGNFISNSELEKPKHSVNKWRAGGGTEKGGVQPVAKTRVDHCLEKATQALGAKNGKKTPGGGVVTIEKSKAK